MKLTRFKLLTLSFTVLGALCVTAHASAGSLVLTIPKSKPRKIHTQHLLRASTLEKVPLNPAYSRSVADALSQNSTLIALPSGGRGSVEYVFSGVLI